jgi:hypothetical protein
VKDAVLVLLFSVILLVPANVFAQSPERIALFGDFDIFDQGEILFVYGKLPNVIPESFLILQIINPNGDLCQIQQITPLSNGLFLTESIPLNGRICGLEGDYQLKLFYGDYSKTENFQVSSVSMDTKSDSQYLDSAIKLVSEKIDFVQQKTNAGVVLYTERLSAIANQTSDNTLETLEIIYVDLWDEFFIEEEIFEIDSSFRPAISDALESTTNLVETGKLSFDIAKEIDRVTYSVIFYFEIGDTKKAVERLNDVYVLISNADPVKIIQDRPKSFEELEESLLNLMKKSHSVMGKQVKSEIAFIFARGTAPLFADEIEDLIDLLTKARYLDVITRNEDPIYRLTASDWESTKSSLQGKESIEELLELKEKVDKLHQASLLLRQLDKVERFISSDEEQNTEIANLISPRWDSLKTDLELATTVDSILDSEQDIVNMKNVIDASSRISKTIEISRASNLNNQLIEDWELLLAQVDEAISVEEILKIVSDFDKTMTDLREKRNPLNILRFDYEALKSKAEVQADNKNLFVINNALKIIDTAQKMEQGNPSVSKIDRIEVLLAWASTKAPEIEEELNSYSKDAYKIRAADILQRAKSVENLVELSLTKNRFLPGYTDFADSMMEKIDDTRELVIKNDLDSADISVRELFSEWQEVSVAYSQDPFGSDVGYSIDELKRIEYRKQLDDLSSAVSTFYNADFASHSDQFFTLNDEASDLLDQGNFVGAESKIKEIKNFLTSYLKLNNAKIIFNTDYDQENEIWILQGYLDKSIMDRRHKLHVTVYTMDGTPSEKIEFYDTKDGAFYTQWHAPVEPGLYVIMLEYLDSKASQIISIEDKNTSSYSSLDLARADLSKDFEELKDFVEKFGGANLNTNIAKFDSAYNKITSALGNNDLEEADKELSELKRLIERYLPVRSRTAVIDVVYNNDKLFISGAVQKTISFSEDLYVDIFDQRGNRISEISLKDSTSGKINEVISQPFEPGIYVAQLQYHDLIVSDFFKIGI